MFSRFRLLSACDLVDGSETQGARDAATENIGAPVKSTWIGKLGARRAETTAPTLAYGILEAVWFLALPEWSADGKTTPDVALKYILWPP